MNAYEIQIDRVAIYQPKEWYNKFQMTHKPKDIFHFESMAQIDLLKNFGTRIKDP
jgi:hypothetical protein